MTPPELKGKALRDRAAELKIPGRSTMKADELRAAVTGISRTLTGKPVRDPRCRSPPRGLPVPGLHLPGRGPRPHTRRLPSRPGGGSWDHPGHPEGWESPFEEAHAAAVEEAHAADR